MSKSGIEGLVDIEFAAEYDERKATHLDRRDSARATGKSESWPVRGIAYDHGLTRDIPNPITVNGVRLEGMEVIIYNQILGILDAKEKVDEPVVVLDLGGMYGIPFTKLAKATEDLVKQSRVAYVVSNLSFNPKTMSNEEVKSFTGLGHSDYDDFFLQNRDLVHYTVSDVDELRNIHIDLPNGVHMPLYGNIDLIHEKDALGKSQLLDTDLPNLGMSLSPYGTIYLGDKNADNTVNPTAFRIGEKNLLKTGVNKVNLGKGLRYNVYIKPKAPTS